MVLVVNPIFWAIGNHLGSFSEASDQPEGQEKVAGAVGTAGLVSSTCTGTTTTAGLVSSTCTGTTKQLA